MLSLLVSALAVRAAPGAGLRDPPVQGDSVTYLDNRFGDQPKDVAWKAEAELQTPPSGKCEFLDNTDYDHEGEILKEIKNVATPQDCCAECEKVIGCAAGVLSNKICYLKDALAVTKPSTLSGRTACKPSGAPKTTPVSIPATIPGDLLSDLQAAKMIGDPLYELNFLNASIWDANVWNFTTAFSVPGGQLRDGEDMLLVFDGIKMGADIYLNGQKIGNATDQFLRYVFPVGANGLLRQGDNVLTISFNSDMCVDGRFMACTGGWDWAPYTNTYSSGTKAHTFTKGMWKSVYLVRVSSAAIMSVNPQVVYRGAYPVTPLVDGENAGFTVTARVRLWAPRDVKGRVTVQGAWGSSNASDVISLKGGQETEVTVTVAADAKDIKLWWPVGAGPAASQTVPRPLYDVTTTFTASSSEQAAAAGVSTTRRVGFRFFALVTGNDTDPEYVKDSEGKEGTSDLGMWWRVNGVPVWSRGANMIPMEELEGQLNAEAHRRLVQSAVEGRMNTLRVWGGGMFLPEAWYDACDEMGVLVYHDMQYAQQGHSPDTTDVQDAELRHNVRRLSAHPSIVMWDGCNECHVIMNTSTGIYASFVMTVVAEEDKSRVVWPSCPASGWTAGVERLTSIPTGNPLDTPKGGPRFETHGPYQHGTGFPSVNGANDLQPFDPNIPIQITPDPSAMGITQSNVFASEFGCVVMSSFESMSPTIAPDHWSLHGGSPPDNCSGGFGQKCVGDNVMAQRNYVCDSIIDAYFNTEKGYFDAVGEAPFKRQLWQCMVGQALEMKSNIETRRSLNELGHLVWQLNEIWPTGGWGSLEYGNPSYPGQVIGGRWKPLHYWYRSSIFADVMATCGKDGVCYVRNDAAGRAFDGAVRVQSVNIATGKSDWDKTFDNVKLAAGPGALQAFSIPSGDAALDGTTHFLIIDVMQKSTSQRESRNVLLLEPPKNLKGLPDNSGLDIEVAKEGDEVSVTIKSKAPAALFVTLTTQAAGRFSDNVFPVIGGEAKVTFIPFGDLDMDKLKATIRVEDLAMYQKPSA